MVKISLLGPVSVEVDGESMPIASRQAKQALAVLSLAAGRTVTSEALADELWPEHELKNVRNALQATIRRLRRSLEALDGPGQRIVISTVPAGYRLDIERHRVDAWCFRDLVTTARADLEEHPQLALDKLNVGLAMWRDGALQDLPSVGRMGAEQRQLNESRAEALEMRAEARITLGELRGAAAELRLLVGLYPDRERLHELLMFVLYQGGQQSEALRAFRDVHQRLRTEFGISPGHRLKRLHDAILIQDVAISAIR